jgi:uncharacterized paraquat-inducible protein A
MPNYKPKGRARMAEIGRIGGQRSAQNARELRLIRYTAARAAIGCSWEELMEALRPPDFTGGDHRRDWVCSHCGYYFNGARRSLCVRCLRVVPVKGRLTRAMRERQEQPEPGRDWSKP